MKASSAVHRSMGKVARLVAEAQASCKADSFNISFVFAQIEKVVRGLLARFFVEQ